MKVYVVYVLSDYATAVFMSVDEKLCEKERNEVAERTGYHTWIEEYDFSIQKSFELDCG